VLFFIGHDAYENNVVDKASLNKPRTREKPVLIQSHSYIMLGEVIHSGWFIVGSKKMTLYTAGRCRVKRRWHWVLHPWSQWN